MDRLSELAEKYGSDKVGSIRHPYTPFYDQLLRDRDVKRVLEIGIGTLACMQSFVQDYKAGASLRMWEEYFHDAVIWGWDSDNSALIDAHNIHSLYCDQSSEESLIRAAGYYVNKFDLIIDDGSHKLEDQALTANTLIPLLLSPTGVYVIEDVMFRRELYPLLPWPVEVKLFDCKRTPDDCLFIIEGSKI